MENTSMLPIPLLAIIFIQFLFYMKLKKRYNFLEMDKRELQIRLELLKESSLLAEKSFHAMADQSKAQFENLASHLFEAKMSLFQEKSETNLGGLLSPLKEKLEFFEQSISNKYQEENKERYSLKREVEILAWQSEKIAKETALFSMALRGDKKFQGDFGELILERVLELSGLREGIEFEKQQTFTNEEGERYRPDITLLLPAEKHLIIDSKVSLKSYEEYLKFEEEYFSNDFDEENPTHHHYVENLKQKSFDKEKKRALYLQNFTLSLKKHIDDLGDKFYHHLKGIRSPEVVFLFIPLEGAYLLALKVALKDQKRNLSEYAWSKGIVLVTGHTLLATLKTVASLWKMENHNKHALKIAEEGGKLYDKFVSFIEDFEKVGTMLDQGQKSYHQALNKLQTGHGNVFRKMENLKDLGVLASKKIKPEFLL